MDSRAKQRLTGAIILVALFVLLVPELLTGPKNAAQAPPAEEGMRSYTIDLDAPAASPAQPPTESVVALPPVANAPTSPQSGLAQPGEAATSDPAEAPTAAQPAPKPAATSPTSGSAQPGSAPAPTASAAPKPASAATPAETSRVATPPARESRPANAPAGGRFVVQLGSFGSRENAERLVREMNGKGFATFIAPITTNGRELYRVRVGPTKDRASAEALAAQLKRMGQSGSIVPIP